jgi:hypothetical protein
MHNHMQARSELSLRTNVPHNAKPRNGDIICRSDNITTAWLSLVGVACIRKLRSLLACIWLCIYHHCVVIKSRTKNPVRDSTTITDRKCGAHVVCAVFRRTATTTQPQPWIGLHRCIYLMQPTLGLVIW